MLIYHKHHINTQKTSLLFGAHGAHRAAFQELSTSAIARQQGADYAQQTLEQVGFRGIRSKETLHDPQKNTCGKNTQRNRPLQHATQWPSDHQNQAIMQVQKTRSTGRLYQPTYTQSTPHATVGMIEGSIMQAAGHIFLIFFFGQQNSVPVSKAMERRVPEKLAQVLQEMLDGWVFWFGLEKRERAKRETYSDFEDVRDIEFEDKSLVSQALGSLVRIWLNHWEKIYTCIYMIYDLLQICLFSRVLGLISALAVLNCRP